jgi:peroxiredoxin
MSVSGLGSVNTNTYWLKQSATIAGRSASAATTDSNDSQANATTSGSQSSSTSSSSGSLSTAVGAIPVKMSSEQLAETQSVYALLASQESEFARGR